MATNILRKTKTVLTNPISSKTIYPFVIDKKINKTGDFLEIGRLIRPVNSGIFYEAELTFQCIVPNITNNKLNIQFLAELYKDGIASGNAVSENFSILSPFSGYIKKTILFDNTNDNNEIRISVGAINEIVFSNSVFANYINLVYLEKKEE